VGADNKKLSKRRHKKPAFKKEAPEKLRNKGGYNEIEEL
jgi:hypothetical protein